MKFFKLVPCHMCEKLYPEFLQFHFDDFYFCPFDYYTLNSNEPITLLECKSSSSKFDNAIWIHDLKHYFLNRNIKAYVKTRYAESNDELVSIFELKVVPDENIGKVCSNLPDI
jgi:hypothetical protein